MNVSASPRSGESMSKGPASSTRFLQATLCVELDILLGEGRLGRGRKKSHDYLIDLI
jgi:hypothetical protein